MGNLTVDGTLTQTAAAVHYSIELNGGATQTTVGAGGNLALFPVAVAPLSSNCGCAGNVNVYGTWDLGNGLTNLAPGVQVSLTDGCTLVDGWQIFPRMRRRWC